MICFELTTETPEEMITLLRGLNLEGTKDEPMREVQEEGKVLFGEPYKLPADARLEETPEEATPDREESPVDELITLCRESADFLIEQSDSFRSSNIQEVARKIKKIELAIAALKTSADVMKIMSKNLQEITEGCVDTAVDLVNCIHKRMR